VLLQEIHTWKLFKKRYNAFAYRVDIRAETDSCKNIDVHFTAVKSITEDGVVGEDGKEQKADTIVCATGFDVSYRPRFPVIGRNGIDLGEKWKDAPESYLGLLVSDMPNFVMFVGPQW